VEKGLLTRRRHHHHRRRLRGTSYFKGLGPGIVTGAADDDPSGIGTYSQVGARFRLGFLWSVPVLFVLASAVQENAARLGLVNGKGLTTLIRERFPKVVLVGAVLLASTANVFNIAADLRAMAASARLIAPIPFVPLVVGIASVILVLEVFVNYHRYSRVLKWLTLSLVAYIGVAAVVKVDWGAVILNAVIPSLSFERSSLAALIAIFGTTISPYLFFWQASEEVEEEIEHPDLTVDSSHIRTMRKDVMAGMAAAVVVMAAIMIATSETLGASGMSQIETADEAARALRPIAGDLAGTIFALGIIGTGALAVPVLAAATGYALPEAFGWSEGLSMKLREAPGFYAVIAVALVLALALGFGGLDPVRGLYYAAILNGVVAPPLILLMLLLGRSESMGEHRSGWLSVTLTGTTCLVMAVAPLAYLIA